MKIHLFPFITCILGFLIGTWVSSSPPHIIDAPSSVGGQAKHATPKVDTHAHVERPVDPALPIPSVKITLHPDTMGGYNLQATLTNFTVTPQDAGDAPKANEGHMHVYINGTKVGRMYGEWMYLKADLFSKEANQVDVTLNANDHADWLHAGAHIGDGATVPPHKGAPMMMHK